ncbi:hypothetical protein AB0F13_19105 [Streptomyces sp. NPDC026206]
MCTRSASHALLIAAASGTALSAGADGPVAAGVTLCATPEMVC